MARRLGIVALVGSTLSLSAMGLLVRMAGDFGGLTSSSVAFVRFLVGASIVLAISRLGRMPLRTGSVRWLVARGVCGGVGVACFYYGITHVGLAKGTVLTYSFPLWGAVMAAILLKEKFRAALVGVLVCASAGLYLVIVPAEGFAGASARDLVPLVGAVFAGVAIVAIRRLRATDSPLVILLSQCVFGMLLLAYPVVTELPRPEPLGWVLVAAVGVTATAGQFMMTYAFRYVSVSEGAPFTMLVPIWNAVMGVVVFGETFTTQGLVGAALVLGACAYAAIPPKERPPGKPQRDRKDEG